MRGANRYEKARILGARALQVSYGAPVLIDTEFVEHLRRILVALTGALLEFFPVFADDVAARETPNRYHHILITLAIRFLVAGPCAGAAPLFRFRLSNVVDEQ